MVWAPITALAALLIALGYMIWQFAEDDRKRPRMPGTQAPPKGSDEAGRVLIVDDDQVARFVDAYIISRSTVAGPENSRG
jgi:hypothetical protein